MIRLLACDLDGTLLDPQRTLHPRHLDAIQRARAAGIEVVLASGRGANSIRVFAEELGLDGPLIAVNGAHAMLSRDVELYHVALPPEVRDFVIDYGLAQNLTVTLYTREHTYTVNATEYAELYAQRVRVAEPESCLPDEAKRIDATKVMLIGPAEAIQQHLQALSSRLTVDQAHMVTSEPEYLEFLPAKTNKGLGLQRLAEHLGIGRQEVAAVGDYMNDLEMLAWAGTSAAMAGAPDEVKAVCGRVLGTNSEGAVADFVDSLLANR